MSEDTRTAEPTALSERPVILVPTGEWHEVFDGLPEWDLDTAGQRIGSDFTSQTGLDVAPEYDEADFISGLGAECPFYLLDLWTWAGRVADTAALAVLGAQIVRYVRGMARRLDESSIESVDASKLRPVLGGPLMRLVATKYAMDDDPDTAALLLDWSVAPLFSQLVGDSGFFHAQQSFLVTGRGPAVAFVGVFDALRYTPASTLGGHHGNSLCALLTGT
jgi:hypothetical protein